SDDAFRLFWHHDLYAERQTNAALVCRPLVLRDDPIPAETVGFAIRGIAVANEPPRDEQRSGPTPDERHERGATFTQWPRHQRSAVLLEEIEDCVPRRRSTGAAAPL